MRGMSKGFLSESSLLAFLLVVVVAGSASAEVYKKVCYIESWAQYRMKAGEFEAKDINPYLCTHLVLAYAKIEDRKLTYSDDSDVSAGNGKAGFYESVTSLKNINANLKVLLSIGGWNAGSSQFESVIVDENSMAAFAKSASTFLRRWRLDGLDIDWQFPVGYKREFTRLLETIKADFDREAATASARLLLTTTISPRKKYADAYDIPRIGQLVEFANVLSYDFHGSWEAQTGHHAGLYPRKNEILPSERELNVDSAVRYLLSAGLPREKLVLGVAFFGRGFTLEDPYSLAGGVAGAAANGPSTSGKIIQEAGFLAYFEICDLIKSGEATYKFDDEQKVPNIKIGQDWIGYENEDSLAIKSDYVKSRCLGGVMVWAIDLDDFKGNFCDKTTYPLLRTLNDKLKERDGQCIQEKSVKKQEVVTPATTTTTTTTTSTTPRTTSSTTTTTTTTTAQTTTSFKAQSEFGAHFEPFEPDCRFFKLFLKGAAEPIAVIKCPGSLWFDPAQETCVAERPNYCDPDMNEKQLVDQLNTVCNLETRLPETTALPSPTSPSTSPVVVVTKTTTPVSTKVAVTSAAKKGEQFACPSPSGSFPYPGRCDWYWECTFNTPYRRKCPAGLVFNPKYFVCDYKSSLCPDKKLAQRIVLVDTAVVDQAGPISAATSLPLKVTVDEYYCPQDGIFANQLDCRSFYQCSGGKAKLMTCPGSLLFNEATSSCEYESSCHSAQSRPQLLDLMRVKRP